jgi:glycosyltransferase involved in cell wall biosynthesis
MVKILISSPEYAQYGSGIGTAVYMAKKYMEKIDDVSVQVLTKEGGDINIGGRTENLPGVLGLISFWENAADWMAHNKDNFDVMWLHAPLLIKNANKLRSIRGLITFHTTYWGFYNAFRAYGIARVMPYYKIINKIEQRFFNNLTVILQNNPYLKVSAISSNIAFELRKNGLLYDFPIIPNGVDLKKFIPINDKRSLRKRYGLSEDALVLSYVGRITHQKQPLRLIKFFSELSQNLNNTNLIVAGRGDLINEARTYGRACCGENIKFLGYVPDEELPLVYSCSDIFILASIYEGLPISLLEAMACGILPLVSNIPGMVELVNDSKSGLIVNFNNIDEAVQKTMFFLKSENLQQQSKQARRFLEENYTWEKAVAKYLQVLNDTCT